MPKFGNSRLNVVARIRKDIHTNLGNTKKFFRSDWWQRISKYDIETDSTDVNTILTKIILWN